jgi:DNA adenine methylase
MPVTNSPLRYPGGKSQLTPFVIEVMRANNLFYGEYAEPFAGGAGIACTLLFDGYVSKVHINDLDPAVHAFWTSAVFDTEAFIRLVEKAKLTIPEWKRQRAVHTHGEGTELERGFAAFYLNRTNRSGIINGGVIGGLNQIGNYKLDCRFNKANLIKKLERLAAHRDQISVTSLDALEFIRRFRRSKVPTLINIDPPYYVRGPELYGNWFTDKDHRSLARAVEKISPYWMLTYDQAPQIRALYDHLPCFQKDLRYSAQVKRTGSELLVLDPRLKRPTGLSKASRAPRRREAA